MRNVKSIAHDIRRVLMQNWDPVGIAEVPEAHDEYDSYVPVLERKIEQLRSADDIARFLLSAEQDMGIELNPVRALDVAERLLRIQQIS